VIEMVRRFLRQRSRSTGVVVVLCLLAGLTAVTTGGRAAAGPGGYLALLILAAASISRDASSGALQMILARPIRRTDYLFGRYVGIVAAFAAYMLLCVLFALLVRVLWVKGAPPLSPTGLLADFGYGTLWAAQIAATLVFFSTFLPGYGDVISVVVLEALLSIRTNAAGIQKVAESLRRELLPSVSWESVFRGDPAALAAAGRAVLAATLFLSAAVLIFSRREFAYGRD
jgi:ABC-type transport system involved in multi-copper enzyme maturation permease subunit